MSEYHIPFHIQEEIMKRLPVRSLIQFRSVSKAWKSLIDSSQFIAAHSLHRHTQKQHLLVSCKEPKEKRNYVCYIDDDTFPQQRSLPTLPLFVKQLINPRVVGSSQGVVCLYASHPNLTSTIAVLWNPSIRKSTIVAVPGQPFVCFGVCPVTGDPKIVSITRSSRYVPESSYQCEVKVYTLSSRKWRILSINLSTKRLLGSFRHFVVIDHFIYWSFECETNMIMSFDLTSESFEVIDLPDSLAPHDPYVLNICNLRESLALFQYGVHNGDEFCTVWIMEHGAQISFTKLFTITTEYPIKALSKSGVPIMEVADYDTDDCGKSEVVVYEPNSKQNIVLEMCPSFDCFTVTSYMETLLLLGRSGCSSY